MIEIHKEQGGIHIILQAVTMGSQWTVVITGGEAHLGAAALAIPRPSLTGSGQISASVSVLTVTGHMDDEIARPSAWYLAKELNQPVLVSCGIHYDAATADRLALIKLLTREAQKDFLQQTGRIFATVKERS